MSSAVRKFRGMHDQNCSDRYVDRDDGTRGYHLCLRPSHAKIAGRAAVIKARQVLFRRQPGIFRFDLIGHHRAGVLFAIGKPLQLWPQARRDPNGSPCLPWKRHRDDCARDRRWRF